jgi:hypothetical protein
MNVRKKVLRPKNSAPASLMLQIELVPKRLWEQNLRSSEGLGKARWDKLRRELIKERGARCEICGAIRQRLNGHEVWDYREKKTIRTAVLLNVEIVCVDCHDIHHWGRTRKLFEDGKITAERYKHLRRHFRTVNDCSQEVFDKHFLQSARLWEQRSKKEWKIDWGAFALLVAEAKAARDAWAERNPGHDDYFGPDPGHHVPGRCPDCGTIGKLTPVEADRDQMSEGEEAEYEAGTWGFAFCEACQSNVFWQV